jgi:transcriptional regulator with XRE-family HTH domain
MKHYRDQDFIERVGKKVVEIRKRKNISQEDLIERSGLSLSQIGRVERAEINTSISMIALIADSLGVHPSEVIDVEFDITPEYIPPLPPKKKSNERKS